MLLNSNVTYFPRSGLSYKEIVYNVQYRYNTDPQFLFETFFNIMTF
jgi:hypothetical protein